MRGIFSERNLVVVLFAMVLITFSFAQKETRKMEALYFGISPSAGSSFIKTSTTRAKNVIPVFTSFYNPLRVN